AALEPAERLEPKDLHRTPVILWNYSSVSEAVQGRADRAAGRSFAAPGSGFSIGLTACPQPEPSRTLWIVGTTLKALQSVQVGRPPLRANRCAENGRAGRMSLYNPPHVRDRTHPASARR